MRLICTSILILLTVLPSFAQEKSLKDRAIDEFKQEHYDEAISILEQALVQSPNDADIYYYLGWFNHYRAYDSRPLLGYDYSHSEKIFSYFDRALELNPNHGDAKYFYGAECSGNAFYAMQNHDAKGLKTFYQKAFDKGAYPAWLLEYGSNFLASCEQNAILFTGGNADFDVCAYLQQCRGIRSDITLVSLGMLDRPWYVKFLKQGLKNSVVALNISLTDSQIMDIHPFKWRTANVEIPISDKVRSKYSLSADYEFVLLVNPDLTSERMHSKMEGETAKPRAYLSPQRAILLQIVEDNFKTRPVYFSNFANPVHYGGFNEFFQNNGLVSKLLPIKTENTANQLNVLGYEKLLSQTSLHNYSDIVNNNIPRVSMAIFWGYVGAAQTLGNIYATNGEVEKLNKLAELCKSRLCVGYNSAVEQQLLDSFKLIDK